MPVKIDAREIRAAKKSLKTRFDTYRNALKAVLREENDRNNEAFGLAFENLDEEKDSAALVIRLGNSQGTDTRELADLLKQVKERMAEKEKEKEMSTGNPEDEAPIREEEETSERSRIEKAKQGECSSDKGPCRLNPRFSFILLFKEILGNNLERIFGKG